MPGDNCCIPGCGSSRRTKGLGMFKLPSIKKNNLAEWRKQFLHEILKVRELDTKFKAQLEADTVHICEKHFLPHEWETFVGPKMTLKKLVPPALPTMNMPQKSHSTEKTSRPYRSIVQDDPPDVVCDTRKHVFYSSLSEVIKRIENLKTIDNWIKEVTEHNLMLSKKAIEIQTYVPLYKVIIDDGLGFTIKVYDCLIPEDHFIYKKFKRSLTNVTVSELIKEIESCHICPGIDLIQHNDAKFIFHVVPLINDSEFDGNDTPPPIDPFPSKKFIRHIRCHVLSNEKCHPCTTAETELVKKRLLTNAPFEPAKTKAPLSVTSKGRIIASLQATRLECKQTKAELAKLKTEIQKRSVNVDADLRSDLDSMFENAKEVTPFMRTFWEQQLMLRKSNPNSVRYHPMLIRYCLSLYIKSKSVYEELRSSGILVLPSSRTLQDYKNFITPKPGFSDQIIHQLKDTTKNYFDVERYIVLIFDEMKIKSNLVFDKHTNQLKGFIDLGTDSELSELNKEKGTLASHALVFYLRGVVSDLKFSFAYFATDGLVSVQIMSLFWDAIAILEKECNLWVIATTCDGASPNRSFFQLHREDKKICFKTINIFASHRFIYFFSDAPHLVKTTRNCWASSGSGKKSRFMWNNGKHVLWQHISNLFMKELENCGCKSLLSKITLQHIQLTPYSVMTVRYAAQVLSSTVSVALRRFGGDDASETSHFCHLMDSFFDCFNTRHLEEAQRKRKPFLSVYRSQDDERFIWLKEVFLKYLDDWQLSIKNRDGNFTKTEREKMFLSRQTYTGLVISVNSLIECTKFLLEGVEYVLSERFCQDILEEYFGNQRKLGRQNDNPDINQFGYNDNALRIQRYLSHSSGNSQGRFERKKAWVEVTDEPLPKLKRR